MNPSTHGPSCGIVPPCHSPTRSPSSLAAPKASAAPSSRRSLAPAGAWSSARTKTRGGAEVAAAATTAGPGRARFVRCDVARPADLERFVADVGAAEGRIDCLVNNAGWHPPHKSIDDFSVDEFRLLLELNLRQRLRRLRGRRCPGSARRTARSSTWRAGGVDGTASRDDVRGDEGRGAGVHEGAGDRRGAVRRARERDLTGNVYMLLWQEATDQVRRSRPRTRADGEAAQPLGRMGTPHEVARLCLYLAGGGDVHDRRRSHGDGRRRARLRPEGPAVADSNVRSGA